MIPTNVSLLRRILVAFIRNEVRKVGLERVVVGLSGGVDSSLSAMLAAEALGPEQVLGIMMPYRASSAESLEHAPAGGGEERHPFRGRGDHRPDRRLFRGVSGRRPQAPGQQDGPGAHDHPLRPLRPVGCAGGRHQQQDRAAAGLRHPPRRHGVGPQPPGGPLQDPGMGAERGRRRPPTSSSTRNPPPTCGPGRPTRPSWASATARWTSCSTSWWTSATAAPSSSPPASSPASSTTSPAASGPPSSSAASRLIAKVSHRTIDRDFRYSRDWGR